MTVGGRRRWTDDELREAVAHSHTIKEVKGRLGLGFSGASHYTVNARIRELGLDISHFSRDSRRGSRPWTENALRAAVAANRTYPDILAALGVELSNATYHLVLRDIRRLQIPRDHLERSRSRGKRRWSEEQLRSAVAASRSIAAVLRELGLVPAGGNYDLVQATIAELHLDTMHFTGAAWNTGGVQTERVRIPLSSVLVAGRHTSSHTLKLRLFREGLKEPNCELCGWAERAADGRIPVELDHINGDRFDNRLENLRILCPNCHSLQPTHRGLNQARRRR
jgi:transposase-like protein